MEAFTPGISPWTLRAITLGGCARSSASPRSRWRAAAASCAGPGPAAGPSRRCSRCPFAPCGDASSALQVQRALQVPRLRPPRSDDVGSSDVVDAASSGGCPDLSPSLRFARERAGAGRALSPPTEALSPPASVGADARGAPPGSEPCASPAEVAGQQRGDRGDRAVVSEHLLRRRSALGVQARQPGGHVEHGVARAREVPVDQHRPAVAEAEVVAADVEMQQPVALEAPPRPRCREGRQMAHRATSSEHRPSPGTARGRRRPRATRRARTGCCARPAGLAAARSRRPRGGTASTASTRSGDHGGGHVGAGQILEHQHGPLAVVVPAQERRQVGPWPGERVEEVLVADPRRRVVGVRDLHEAGRAVRQRRPPIARPPSDPHGSPAATRRARRRGLAAALATSSASGRSIGRASLPRRIGPPARPVASSP